MVKKFITPRKSITPLTERRSSKPGITQKSGTGFTRTATNRATGQKTTTTGTTKPVTGSEYNGTGRYKKTGSARKKY